MFIKRRKNIITLLSKHVMICLFSITQERFSSAVYYLQKARPPGAGGERYEAIDVVLVPVTGVKPFGTEFLKCIK